MSTKRTKKTTTARTRRRTRRRRTSTSRSKKNGSTAWRRNGTALPGWDDLAPGKNARVPDQEDQFLKGISTGRFAALLLLFAVAFTAYVGHVHATQDLYERVEAERQENQRLHLKADRLQGELNRATGPRVVHERARELGFQENLSFGPTIHVETE